MIDEVWNPVNGYEGYYQVSNLGRVRSVDRSIERKDGSRGRNASYKGRLLRPSASTGYNRVILAKGGGRFNHKISRLVAIAFIPNPENKREVNHIDGNKVNDKCSNLEWATSQENQIHAFSTGLQISHKGVNHGMVKLTLDLIEHGKALRKMGYSYKAIGSLIGVSGSQAHRALTGRNWKHLS